MSLEAAALCSPIRRKCLCFAKFQILTKKLFCCCSLHFTVQLTFRFTRLGANQWTVLGVNQSTELPVCLFWSQSLKFCIFSKLLAFFEIKKQESDFFENQKSQTISGFWIFFSRRRLWLWQKVSELRVQYKSLLTRVYDHANNIAMILLLP